ncbi:hypothetical protein [Adlercreutzia muris]|uniref:hypothetical protein n=1 Tax=Adlercreutzia muris TaxID=1796610 RepID=UPI0035121EBC
MGSLEQRAPERAEIPRFDDGMVNIQEFIGIMAESLINETMDAQAEDACADRKSKRRSRVVPVLPARKSLIRMLGAVLSKADEDRAPRRWLAEESIALAAAPMRVRAPTPSYDGTAGEHTTRATEAVVAATRSEGGQPR